MHDNKTGIEISQADVNYALYLAALQTVRINSIHQWEKTQNVAASNTTSEDIDVKMDNEDNRIYVITHVAAVNIDKDTDTIMLYNVKSGQEHLLNSDNPSGKRISVNWDGELITGPNQLIRARFVTNDTGDDIRVTVSGYWVPK